MRIICGEPCCVWGGWGWVSRSWSPERYISSPDLPLTKQHSLYKLFSSYKSIHTTIPPEPTLIPLLLFYFLLSSFFFSFPFLFLFLLLVHINEPPFCLFLLFFIIFCASSLYLAFFFKKIKFRERVGALDFYHFISPPPEKEGAEGKQLGFHE